MRILPESSAKRLALLALLVFPAFTLAQPRIGYVNSGAPGSPTDLAFREGLREAGYAEGGIVVEARYARGRQELLAGLVEEVLRAEVKVLVVSSTRTAVAAKRATSTVPIVFASVFDPLGAGLVASLARPGGNVTGVAMGVGREFGGKWLELLREAMPGLAHAAVLWNSANASSGEYAEGIRDTAQALGVKIDLFDAGNAESLERSLAAIGASRAQGLVVAPDPYFNAHRARLVEFAARRRLPAVYFFRSFAEAGGLMAYGADHAASVRAAARFVDKILKGASPAELPVEQPTRFELVINRKAARALGLTLPPSLLLRADHVIE